MKLHFASLRFLAAVFGIVYLAAALAGDAKTEADLLFVDISRFDEQLANKLESKGAVIAVGFYENVSPNSFPPRMERWLKAVEKNGGQIIITPPVGDLTPRNPALLIGLLGSLWGSLKAFNEIKEERLLQRTMGRDAELVLERNAAGNVTVARVNFKPK